MFHAEFPRPIGEIIEHHLTFEQSLIDSNQTKIYDQYFVNLGYLIIEPTQVYSQVLGAKGQQTQQELTGTTPHVCCATICFWSEYHWDTREVD